MDVRGTRLRDSVYPSRRGTLVQEFSFWSARPQTSTTDGDLPRSRPANGTCMVSFARNPMTMAYGFLTSTSHGSERCFWRDNSSPSSTTPSCYFCFAVVRRFCGRFIGNVDLFTQERVESGFGRASRRACSGRSVTVAAQELATREFFLFPIMG